MGVHDRPYMKAEGGGSIRERLGSIRFMSVNTWIIVLCVAVFVTDSFLPRRWVPTGRIEFFPGVTNVDRQQAVQGPDQREVRRVMVPGPRGNRVVEQEVVRRPYLASRNGPQIGWVQLEPMHAIESFLYLSTARIVYGVEFWRLVGFQFLHSHATITHLLFNMLGLYFFGPLVERWLGGKRYLAFYLLCGICGAIVYLVLNLLGIVGAQVFGPDFRVPGLLFHDLNTPLIGASAGVFGVIMAGAYLAPNATVLVFFVLPMRLATLAYALVGIAVLALLFSTSNAGGQAAHLGGAIAGWYFIRNPRHLHGFFDVLGRVDPTSRSNRARRTGAAPGTPTRVPAGEGPSRGEIDRILDKISSHGIQSLTAAEKRALREASGRG